MQVSLGGDLLPYLDKMHLTLDDRNIIEQELNQNNSFKNIALLLDKDPTTIAKEVRIISSLFH